MGNSSSASPNRTRTSRFDDYPPDTAGLDSFNDSHDGFSFSSIGDNSNPPEIPCSTVETFAQSRIDKYESRWVRFGRNPDQDYVLTDGVSRIPKLTNLLGESLSGPSKSPERV
ncbi:hypothetical protein Nepgr_029248 [Nepenthes gracilis]|uniref:Uncharacterized protein n=1 Tax=Nepenthes gracilis TaxID=150966 RepID=A0AAD3Y4P2_NEPGR|nr:hypothetical protein Nepgr_029248 [Nepenthes gracilis]